MVVVLIVFIFWFFFLFDVLFFFLRVFGCFRFNVFLLLCLFFRALFGEQRRKRLSHFWCLICASLDSPCFALALGRVVVALELECAVNVGRLLESASIKFVEVESSY